jgi:predicted glycoside hydrolase/deacetylase ChbG (UPF0249 family)
VIVIALSARFTDDHRCVFRKFATDAQTWKDGHMHFKKMSIVVSAAAAVCISASVPVHAQQTTPAPELQTPPTDAASFSDDTLKSFADAFLEIASISQEYQPQLEGAGTPEEQQRVRTEAGGRMLEAVEGTEGISVEEYNQIMEAAQGDPELAQRINTHITDATQ